MQGLCDRLKTSTCGDINNSRVNNEHVGGVRDCTRKRLGSSHRIKNNNNMNNQKNTSLFKAVMSNASNASNENAKY